MMPAWPMLPTGRPPQVAPKACAASSMIGTPFAWPIAITRSMSQAQPWRCVMKAAAV